MNKCIDDLRWIELNSIQDERGCLTVAETNGIIPFNIKRIFLVHNVLKDRGGHAHRDTDQVLIAVSGSLTVRAYDGNMFREFSLNNPTKGLLVPRMIFVDLINFSSGGVCLCLANTHYDMNMSIRSLEEFEKAIL
jgi:dTDP-4-dehydrorhamnose 3,5-epimerase-like enzyme